ncbi:MULTISPECIES: rod shape-determining protein MreC [Paenibacillus]|uniref:Cell shape-determining protein MreC n=1 Tax=Paenibacillus oceani TaxID=2772510 RepID=A0A927C481_9BACL|nr:rod shape-determining protein MreC [Paenibacillus oceani]MBD2861000.1 rod shape-determining protein MreC [Paenibacillus oceani]
MRGGEELAASLGTDRWKVFALFKWLGNKRLIILMSGVIFFVALIGFSFGGRGHMSWPEGFVKDTVTWVQGWINKPARAVAGLFEDIRRMSVLYEENRQLKLTITQYAKDTARLNDLEAQNKRLMDALGFTERQQQSTQYKYRIAEVFASSPDPFNNTIVINLGEKDGIKANMAVMSVDGLIGRVVTVSPFYSNVQLLTDLDTSSSKAIAVTIKGKENESYGILEGYDREKGLLVMNKIPKVDTLEVGDTVVTSGIGQLFPRGIQIGEVVSRDEGEFGITHTALIKPFTSFNHLREVFVIEVPEL